MAALVPEDAPVPVVETGPLVVPDIGVQRVAVAEDDRDGSAGRARHLHVQREAVIGEDGHLLAEFAAEGLVRRRVWSQPDPADRDLLRDYHGAGPRPPPPPPFLPPIPPGPPPRR